MHKEKCSMQSGEIFKIFVGVSRVSEQGGLLSSGYRGEGGEGKCDIFYGDSELLLFNSNIKTFLLVVMKRVLLHDFSNLSMKL